ncbi:dystrobrevin beta-like isoform X2 [Haliotis rufescens]|uniref:dystrobrevin beta-like isoform X2 n=1 Tax=Haliotis rufescens TaxID=6454 RepID=UPI00201F75DC|nr:dystrobrevin beta-like isoform X2 [Haliotis rufescens]
MECLAYNQQRFASVIENINRELHEKGYLVVNDDDNMQDLVPSSSAKAVLQQRQLLTDMRAQNYDVIRFATYRTACKLRFVQKKTSLHLVDIWNMIEAFRENGLNMVDAHFELSTSRLESLLTTVFTQLNKRLPQNQQIVVEQSVNLLLNWLIAAYDKENTGKTRAFTIKVALSHMCAGKFMDKLRYIFTQISDTSGYLVWARFEDYLADLLMLPTAVFEGPSFGYNETAARSCFDSTSRVSVNDFLNVLMCDPGPQCLMWLPVLNRMAHVENVLHPVQCEGCHRESFTGFRYKCQRCFNYHLCQDCFWRGRTSANHRIEHEMKEYTTYKSQAKQIGHSIRKSFQCTPVKSTQKMPHFPDAPEKTIDLSYIVPPTPIPVHNGFPDHPIITSGDVSSLDSSSAPRSPSKHNASTDSFRIDDEHRLIARYAARLAADSSKASQSPSELNFSLDTNKAQRELISQLEAKNREIMREIQRLRLEQEAYATENEEAQYNPTLLAELRLLRQRKDELEGRMQALQESRKDLMVQLESLMKLLKNHPNSPRSTPNSSPRSRSGLSPTIAPPPTKNSTPSTPMDMSLTGLGGDVRQAFHQTPSSGGNVRSLRNDLLVAADSVTNAMSSLVKELNSENSGSDEDDDLNGKSLGHSSSDNYENDSMVRSTGTDDIESWRDDIRWRLKQESEFLAQLRARRQRSENSSQTTSDNEQDPYIPDDGESYVRTDDDSALNTDDGESFVRTDDDRSGKGVETTENAELYDNHPGELMTSSRYTTDEESYLQTDEESYIRTDDEEGGNTDWEESTRRWVNR